MLKRLVPLLALGFIALLGLLLLTNGSNTPPPYDPIGEAARMHELETRRADDAAVAPARQLAGVLWQVLPPVLLLGGLGSLIVSFTLDRRAKRRRLEPDANGFYPLLDPTIVARELAPELAQHLALTMAGGNMQALVQRHTAPPMLMGRGQNHEPAMLPAPVVEATQELPTAPAWSTLLNQGWRPTTQHMLLGYSTNGPVYGGIDALLSTAIAGRPGQGKTTALRFVYAQTVLAGGRVIVMDPHGSIVDALGEGQALWTASTQAELEDGAGWLQEELERRGGAWKTGQRSFTPLLVLCDEWPVISMQSKAAVDAAGRVILEARKWGAYALISGQGLPAGKFSGGSLVRDALSSRFIFRTTPAQARMAGLDTETARLVDTLDVGRCILDGPVDPQIVAIPNTTALDLASLAKTGAASLAETAAASNATTRLAPEEPTRSGQESGKEAATSSPLPAHSGASDVRLERVRQLLLEQRGQKEIIKELWGVTGGNSYTTAARELAGMVAQLVGGAA
jgi:hypothetical protein